MTLCPPCIALSTVALLFVSPALANAPTDETFDPASLYASRSDSVAVPGTDIVISHDEGSIAIESIAGNGGSFFFVSQEMDASGEISFAGLSDPSGEGAISVIYGTLMLRPDGSLRVAYDAYGESGSFEAASVTKLAVGGSILVIKANCDCESSASIGCNQNDCRGPKKPCDDDGSQTGPWCILKNLQVFVQSAGV
jgi:hypothetical protein